MESALLLSLLVSLMFAGGNGYSQSMSCSTVNGKTICENQSGSGNFAGSASMAGFGQGGTYQDAGAMIGDSYSGTSSVSRTQQGYPFPGVHKEFHHLSYPGFSYTPFPFPSFNYMNFAFPGGFPFAGFPFGGFPFYNPNQYWPAGSFTGGGVFVGNMPPGGFGMPGMPGMFGGGAFAGAGGFGGGGAGFDPFAFVFGRRR